MDKKTEALKLALEFNRYFTSANGVDVPHRVSVPRDEWREVYFAFREALAEQSAQQEPVADDDVEYYGMEPWESDKMKSATAGMNMAERILHVGGRNNAAGYVEFGSIQAVAALVRQVLRDLPASKPKNVMRVKRISDQSVELVFTSCAAASEFIVAYGIKGEQK